MVKLYPTREQLHSLRRCSFCDCVDVVGSLRDALVLRLGHRTSRTTNTSLDPQDAPIRICATISRPPGG